MKFPYYVEITIENDKAQDFNLTMDPHSNQEYPLVINITALGKSQGRGLNLIEEYINTHNISAAFPYPIYVMTDYQNYKGALTLISSNKQLPTFYKKSSRKASTKEELQLLKNNMLSQKVSNFQHQENQYKIMKFSEQHKKMYLQSLEGSFLENLITKIRDY
jgi:hypothetical protein